MKKIVYIFSLLFISQLRSINLNSVFKDLSWAQGQISLMKKDNSLTEAQAMRLRDKFKSPTQTQVSATTSGSPISSDEQTFLNNRIPQTEAAIENHFNIPANQNKPKIALMGSGGGFRAMFATTGYLLAAHQMGLLDSAVYMSGLSGSTWVMGPWSYRHVNNGYSIADFVNAVQSASGNAGQSLLGKYYLPENLSSNESKCSLLSSQIKSAWGQGVGFIGIWSSLVGNVVLRRDADSFDYCSEENPRLLDNNRLMLTWSGIAEDLKNNASIPMPLLASVHPTAKGWNELAFIMANFDTWVGLATLAAAMILMAKLISSLDTIKSGKNKAKDLINELTIKKDVDKLVEEGFLTSEEAAEIKSSARLKRVAKAKQILRDKMINNSEKIGIDASDFKDLPDTMLVNNVKSQFAEEVISRIPTLSFEEIDYIKGSANPFETGRIILRGRLAQSLSGAGEGLKNQVMENVSIEWSSAAKKNVYKLPNNPRMQRRLQRLGFDAGISDDDSFYINSKSVDAKVWSSFSEGGFDGGSGNGNQGFDLANINNLKSQLKSIIASSESLDALQIQIDPIMADIDNEQANLFGEGSLKPYTRIISGENTYYRDNSTGELFTEMQDGWDEDDMDTLNLGEMDVF